MTPDEVKALRELAEQATPGPWGLFSKATMGGYDRLAEVRQTCDGEPTRTVVAFGQHDEDGRYLAALSPERVIGLLDSLAELQLERDSAREERDYFMRQLEAERQEAARLRAEVERLKAGQSCGHVRLNCFDCQVRADFERPA